PWFPRARRRRTRTAVREVPLGRRQRRAALQQACRWNHRRRLLNPAAHPSTVRRETAAKARGRQRAGGDRLARLRGAEWACPWRVMEPFGCAGGCRMVGRLEAALAAALHGRPICL